ncbi:lytic transglycosylase domain-containing protein, partial [Vibrio parahaemolyticus]
GTYDYGPMQINSSWWPRFSEMGISKESVGYNACTNVRVGTWILSKNIADGEDLLRGIGSYHSHTLALNQKYTQEVRMRYTELMQLIS